MAPPPERPRIPSDKEVREHPLYAATLDAIGRTVREARLARGLSYYKADQLTEIDWKFLQKIEKGEMNLTVATLVRLALGFELDLALGLSAPKRSKPRRRPQARARPRKR